VRGSRHGDLGKPETNLHNLDETEREICDYIKGERRAATNLYQAQAGGYETRLANQDLPTLVTQIEIEANQAIYNFQALAQNFTPRIIDMSQDLIASERDLNYFQLKHNRDSNAAIKSKLWIYISFLVMCIMFAGESFFNATMLGNGLTGGTAEGLAFAMGFSMINIALGVLVGHFGFRNLNHVEPSRKAYAGLGLILWFVVVLIFNLGIGHFRDGLLGADMTSEAMQLARESGLQSMIRAPFSLQSLESYALLGFGILISILAALDVYAMDDPYPGYGKITRAHKKEKNGLLDASDHVQQMLQDERDKAVGKMTSSRMHVNNWREDYNAVIAGLTQLNAAYTLHLNHLEECGNRLLEAYRTSNIATRLTPPPKHFTDPFILERPVAPVRPKTLPDDQISALLASATETLSDALSEFNSECRTHGERLAELAAMRAQPVQL
jgi:hypothetical protein